MQRNVFLLTVDSLRQDFFGEHFSELSQLLKGVEFTDAIATAADTASAMPGIAASVYSEDIPDVGMPPSGDPELLSERLRANSYRTALWTDNDIFGANYNYDRGFDSGDRGRPSLKKQLANALATGTPGELNSPKGDDTTLDWIFSAAEWLYFNHFKTLSGAMGRDESFYIPAEQIHHRAKRWLSEAETDKKFLWLHYMDVHHPYEPPKEYLANYETLQGWSRSELSKLSRQTIQANNIDIDAEQLEAIHDAYAASCDYLGDQLVDFISTLVEKGHFDADRDVLVLTADHGECLDRSKRMLGHVPPAFWDEILNVPLIISRPDWSTTTIDEQVSLIDVMPTILDAVDIDAPDTAVGSACTRPEEIVTETAYFSSKRLVSDERIKLFRGVRSADRYKLFGAYLQGETTTVLSTVGQQPSDETLLAEDSPGTNPSSTEYSDVWRDLASRLEGRPVQHLDETFSDTGELEQHLESLGYV